MNGNLENLENIGQLDYEFELIIPNTVIHISDDFNNYEDSIQLGDSLGWDDCELTVVPSKQVKISKLTIPNSVITIGERAFSDNNLTTITIPNSVITIGKRAFFDNNLTTITIPNSVITIGEYAFFDNNLTTITIPNSVTTIGEGAFSNNPININEIYTEFQNPRFDYSNIFDINRQQVFDLLPEDKRPENAEVITNDHIQIIINKNNNWLRRRKVILFRKTRRQNRRRKRNADAEREIERGRSDPRMAVDLNFSGAAGAAAGAGAGSGNATGGRKKRKRKSKRKTATKRKTMITKQKRKVNGVTRNVRISTTGRKYVLLKGKRHFL